MTEMSATPPHAKRASDSGLAMAPSYPESGEANASSSTNTRSSTILERPVQTRRVSNRLKKRRDAPHSPTMELPDRLRLSPGDGEEDVVPPPAGGGPYVNMTQSIFGMIAAAGSRLDFNDRFEGQSSDEDDEAEGGAALSHMAMTEVRGLATSSRKSGPQLSQSSVLRRPGRFLDPSGNTRTRLSGSRLLKSVPGLSKLSGRNKGKSVQEKTRAENIQEEEEEESEDTNTAQTTKPVGGPRAEGRLAPVLSRMLEAKAQMAARPSFDMERPFADQVSGSGENGPSDLALKLAEIFDFAQPEEVIEEYPCWLLQHVLLQGYMYITTKHVAFYAYLPKRANEVAKSGFLSKSGKRNPKYNRYWFRLKGDVLSYYRDSQNLYFPSGQIDLRYGISAAVSEKDKDGTHFTVTTDHRTYHFKADSVQSAKEWVKSLQRVIFRSHNEGDSVKISLPLENVIDIEEAQMLNFADTCKIRVIDNDETYAIDEYFFSFFTFGKEALNVLKTLVEGSQGDDKAAENVHTSSSDEASPSGSRVLPKLRTGRLNEGVRATLTPLSPAQSGMTSPRASGDLVPPPYGRRSMDQDAPRRSFSDSRRSSSKPGLQGLEEAGLVSVVSEDPSGSQILHGSDVFQSPTVRRSASAGRAAPAEEVRVATMPVDGSAGEKTSGGPATIQSINKMTGYPLQRANAFVGYTRRMSTLLATESMGYVEKVSGMWKGGKKHYEEPAELKTDDDENEVEAEDRELAQTRFRNHFALPDGETLQAAYFGYMIRVLPLYGKMYISERHFCFRSLLPGTRLKVILPLKDVENADKENGFRFGYSGLVVVIRGHEELFFEFGKADVRDDCYVTMMQNLEAARFLRESSMLGSTELEDARVAAAERDALQEARQEEKVAVLMRPETKETPTIIFDDPKASFLSFKPQPMRITCLTIGSRGDVQPYIALCKALQAEGHSTRIATHAEFQPWIEGHGIEFALVDGEPSELMRLCIENGLFTVSFLREALSRFRGWMDRLLATAWDACQDSDLLIESPSAMAGVHIAEALGIPYFRAFGMPWTRTRSYPHAFAVPLQKMGGAYNYVTYVMFENVYWKAMAPQVNRWRNKTLGLPSTNLEKLQINKVPFLYNFSPSVVPPPLDFSDWIRVTGYWFLDEGGSDWKPPRELTDFIERARRDEKKLVYVGFGSILVPDPAKMTQEVIDAVLKADVRCILSKGWSDRVVGPSSDAQAEPVLPPEILQISSAPHDWLFRQMDAAAHHGGSGTTGASLRAGIPTIVRPFFGDQFFSGGRVEDLGVGICLRKWGALSFARALWEATHSERMIVKARVLGEQIRDENGVQTAINCIYRDLDYAKSLIKTKTGKNAQRRTSLAQGKAEVEDEDEAEEWTFIGDDAEMAGPDAAMRRLLLKHSSGESDGDADGEVDVTRGRSLSQAEKSAAEKTGGVS